jgi:proteic killer suppression protein
MDIISIKHKGLKRYIEKGETKLLPSKHLVKINTILTVLQSVETIEEFLAYPYGRPHKLKGDRDEYYAVSVYANWRITFLHDPATQTVHILDYEDYH